MKYRLRVSDKILAKKLRTFGGVLIVGPKGCGKTTTARQQAKSLIEFQDEDTREYLLETANTLPSRLLIGEKPRLIDEWQDAPKIWGAVRKSIDDSQEKGQYILTGSSSAQVETAHTGTLRISTMKMYPMSLYESGESTGEISLLDLFNGKDFETVTSPFTFDDIVFATCRGGWPNSLDNIEKEDSLDIARDLFYQTCHHDISHIDKVKRNPSIAQQILRSYSRNICTLAETKTIYADVNKEEDISKASFYQYINALKGLYIIEEINAWCPAIRSRELIRASEKRNLIDPSLAVSALGLSPAYFNTDLKTFGFLFESLCIRDLKIYSSSMGGEISYYHDRYGLEADAVLHLRDGRYALIEFKLGANGIEEGVKHLLEIEELIKTYNEKEKQVPLRLPDLKIVITATNFGMKRDDGVYVLPITCLKD